MKPWKVSIISGVAGGTMKEAVVHLTVETEADTVREVLELVEAMPIMFDYIEYVDAKLEIEEVPFTFEEWKKAEKDMED
jgi:hypothetical protein